MQNRKEALIAGLGRALFLTLFFVFVLAFADQPVKPSRSSFQADLVSEMHIQSVKAYITEASALPSFQKSYVSLVDKLNIKLNNISLRISEYDRDLIRRFLILKKSQTFIRTTITDSFYFLLYPDDSDEFPVLS